MNKHTPGPWEMPGMDGKDYVVCTHKASGKRRTLAHVYKNEANARLIAAAPDMLAELMKIFNTIYHTQHEDYWRPIKEVIERATGQSIEEVAR